jgi:hypothetical protein
MPNARSIAAAREILSELFPTRALVREQSIDLAITEDGRPRVDRATGLLAPESRPVVGADEIFPEGFDADDLQELLESIAGDQIDAARIADGSVSNTEFQYLNGVTSALQTQLNAKLPAASPIATGTIQLGQAATDTIRNQGHMKHAGTVPSIAAGVALGTGGSMGVSISGTGSVGELVVTAGTTSLTTGTAATITFATARPDTNYAVLITPRASNAGANLVGAYATRDTTSQWLLRFANAPVSGTGYAYCYWVFEYSNV